jgi:serine/threonine protein phosphatase 1
VRTFAIGDIHGCHTALLALLEALDLQADDRLVFLGDLVDRGPDSYRVVEKVRELVDSDRAVCLLGNHEEMLLAAQHDPSDLMFWMQVGGASALRSYKDGTGTMRVTDQHLVFLEHRCRLYYEDERCLYVHATARPELDLCDQDHRDLRWTKWRDQGPHHSGKTLIVGHTAMKDGRPRDLGHSVLVDTYCYGGQWLTAFDIDGDRFVQANEVGEVRVLDRGAPSLP